MRGERSRLPRRRTDCIEDAVAWLLTAVGLLVVVLALMAGVRAYGEDMRRIATGSGDRTQIEAVLLEPAPTGVMAGRIDQPVGAALVPVAARYTAADGVEHVADVWVRGPRAAGTPVPIWVDRAGAVTTPPPRRADAVLGATVRAAVIVVPGVFVLAGIWVLLRIGVRRANLARWKREWAQVEPSWSGRTPA